MYKELFLTRQQTKRYSGKILTINELIKQPIDSYCKAIKLFQNDNNCQCKDKNNMAVAVREFHKVFHNALFTENGRIYEF